MKIKSFASLVDTSFELLVDLTRRRKSREQITKKTEEDNFINLDNLWDIEITKSTHKNGILGGIWVSTLELSSNDEDGLNSTQSPIIMLLFGKKILEEIVEGEELGGKRLGSGETFRHHHILTNQYKIWDHDGHRTEKSLQSLWEGGSSEVSRVHGDISTGGLVKSDQVTFNHNLFRT